MFVPKWATRSEHRDEEHDEEQSKDDDEMANGVSEHDESKDEESDDRDELSLDLQGRQTAFFLNRHVVHHMLPKVRKVAWATVGPTFDKRSLN